MQQAFERFIYNINQCPGPGKAYIQSNTVMLYKCVIDTHFILLWHHYKPNTLSYVSINNELNSKNQNEGY